MGCLIYHEFDFFFRTDNYHKFNMILLPQKPCHTWLRFYILLLKELLFFVLFCTTYIFLSFLSRKIRQKSYLLSKISPETTLIFTAMKRSTIWLLSVFTLSLPFHFWLLRQTWRADMYLINEKSHLSIFKIILE